MQENSSLLDVSKRLEKLQYIILAFIISIPLLFWLSRINETALYSEGLALMARNTARFGFLNTKFAMVLDVHPIFPGESNRFEYYIGHPLLNHWFISLSFKVFGAHGWSFHIPAIICTLLAIIFCFLFVRSIWGTGVALITAFFFSLSPIIIHRGDVSNENTIIVLFLILSFYLYNRWVRTGHGKTGLFLLCTLFLACFADWIGFLITPALLLHYYIFQKERRWRYLIALSIPALVFMITMLHFVWVLGPQADEVIRGKFKDAVGILERDTHERLKTDFALTGEHVREQRGYSTDVYLKKMVSRFRRNYTAILLILVPAGIFALIRHKQWNGNSFYLLSLFMIGLTKICLFPARSFFHSFYFQPATIAISILGAIGMTQIMHIPLLKRKNILTACFLCCVAAAYLTEGFYNGRYFKKNISKRQDLIHFVREHVGARDVVLTNKDLMAIVSFYTDREFYFYVYDLEKFKKILLEIPDRTIYFYYFSIESKLSFPEKAAYLAERSQEIKHYLDEHYNIVTGDTLPGLTVYRIQ